MSKKTIKKAALLVIPLLMFVSLFAFTGVSQAQAGTHHASASLANHWGSYYYYSYPYYYPYYYYPYYYYRIY